MVEASFPAFLFAPGGVTWPGIREMIEKLANLKAETLIISDPSNQEAFSLNGRTISIPVPLDELFTPIPYIVPAQLFAACLAAQKGFNPDHSRTLRKVTPTFIDPARRAHFRAFCAHGSSASQRFQGRRRQRNTANKPHGGILAGFGSPSWIRFELWRSAHRQR